MKAPVGVVVVVGYVGDSQKRKKQKFKIEMHVGERKIRGGK